jgi:hypothetical protein
LEALVPILVRPVREQLEHDRIIRLLEAKWKRKFKVEANPGDERNAGIKVTTGTIFPDLVVTEEGGRKPKALVEVETSESVNHLEARAQWAHLAKSRMSLVLFVPAGAVESARRLADENAIKVSELWTYLVLGDQVRFTSVFRQNGLEPADLVEKADVFTTERTAPAPRPIVVDTPPPEPVAAPPPVERARKLAVKVGSKGSITEVVPRSLPKVALKATPPVAPAVAVPKAAATPATAKPAKVDGAPAAKAAVAAAVAAKGVEKKLVEKPAPPTPDEKKAAEKPAAPTRPIKKAPDKIEPKVAAKPAPVKAVAVAKKALPKPATKPVKKAAPAKAPAPKSVAPKPAAPKAAAPKAVAKKAPAKPVKAAKRK